MSDPIAAFERDLFDGNDLSRAQLILFVPLLLALIVRIYLADLRNWRRASHTGATAAPCSAPGGTTDV